MQSALTRKVFFRLCPAPGISRGGHSFLCPEGEGGAVKPVSRTGLQREAEERRFPVVS